MAPTKVYNIQRNIKKFLDFLLLEATRLPSTLLKVSPSCLRRRVVLPGTSSSFVP